jgi:hypothetical protein
MKLKKNLFFSARHHYKARELRLLCSIVAIRSVSFDTIAIPSNIH